MLCARCDCESAREHTDPWACIAALRRELTYHRSGVAAIVAQLEREMGPNDEGDLQSKIQHPGERAYWRGVIEKMKGRARE